MKPVSVHRRRRSAPPPPVTAYANAGGTGNRSAMITVTAVNLAAGGGSPAALVNGAQDNSYFWNSAFSANGTAYLLFDFGVGVSKCIDEFKWYQGSSRTHGTWRFEGSNDGTNWTQCGSDFTLGDGGTGSGTAFPVPNVNVYQMYRLRHMAGDRFSGPYEREIEFKIA